MRALDRKLLRNLWSLRSQGLAIALVVACGVATFVMSLAALDSLRLTQQGVYKTQRFADVFADLKRAPESLADRMREIPGVAVLETRVRAPVRLRLETFDDPVTGLAISIPDGRQPELNRLFLRAGQLPDPGRGEQVLISEAFAEAHGLKPGDQLAMIVNGRLQRLTLAGIALSPEFIYQIRPGDLFPDFSRYAVVWMNRSALAAAFGMEGAFNSLSLTLSPRHEAATVIDALDLLLQPWGSLGAHDRDAQLSHRYLEQELEQLDGMARFLPMIFIGVAAFLLNVVAARLIRTQREQIGVLKAFGYGNLRIALHYLALVLVVVAIGSLTGVIAGAWLAGLLGALYQDFFRFPWLQFRLQPATALLAVAIAGGATMAGTLGAVRAAFRLPPAEAMRPESPPRYRRTVVERLGVGRFLSQPSRMILRNLERQPVKSLLSVLGISLAVAILVLTGFQRGSVNHMLDVQFRLAQQQDLTVTFVEPVAQRAIHELAALPGVRHAEGFRAAPAILRNGHREHRGSLQGYQADGRLFAVLDEQLQPIRLAEGGLMMTDHLARMLGVGPGDMVQVQIQEGRRARIDIPVAGLVTEYVGVGAYVPQQTLNRLLREGPAISGAFLSVEPETLAGLHRRLENLPRVAGVSLRERAIQSFRELMDESVMVFTLFAMTLAGSIAFAVVYNSARIALAERSRELASLRVLGFTRAETAYVLLGELVVLTLAAIPPGFAIGAGFTWLLTRAMETDLYRVPMILTADTFALSAAVVLGATMLSSLLIAIRLRRLDMVSALKASE